MELKPMKVEAILVNGEPIRAYSIQTANDAYKLPNSFGVYAARGYFTSVAQDGKDVKHYLPKDNFDEEIVRFELEGKHGKKKGRPAVEDRIIALHAKVDRILELLERKGRVA